MLKDFETQVLPVQGIARFTIAGALLKPTDPQVLCVAITVAVAFKRFPDRPDNLIAAVAVEHPGGDEVVTVLVNFGVNS